MLVDLLAWTLLLLVASVIGAGALAVLGAQQMRRGDRLVIGAWVGVVLLSIAFLAASLVAPLTPSTAAVTTMMLLGVAVWAIANDRRSGSRRRPAADVPIGRWGLAAGAGVIALGAGALTSDPVTLYDSLVYHVGIMRWLHEHGTVPGMALIHNRLGHASAWFALAAPFDVGLATDRAATIPLGVALVLVAGQGALGVARIVGRHDNGADWFLTLSSLALLWPVVVYDAATPSPDVVTNALIVTVAWALQVVGRLTPTDRMGTWHRLLTPRLLPFVLGVGACTMKLFALPAAIATVPFYVLVRGDDSGAAIVRRRAVALAIVGVILIAPFLAANVVATGCPLFPSSIGCVDVGWSIGSASAADYAAYIRDVARWESRRTTAGLAVSSWLLVWIGKHPVVVMMALLSPIVAYVALRGPRRDGVRSVLLLAILGILFAWWQAPAPRFLYAFAVVSPILALSYRLASVVNQRASYLARATTMAPASRAAVGFLLFALMAGVGYAVASQKVNVQSALRGDGRILARVRADALVPAAPQTPSRLYRWRVNDVEVLTPVPRPIADTLGYRSTILDVDAGFEKCSTAPLPCTPYLPTSDVRLRSPARGLAGGFIRAPNGPNLSTRAVECIGELPAPFPPSILAAPLAPEASARCGEPMSRWQHAR